MLPLFRIDVIQVAISQNSQIKFRLTPAFTKFSGLGESVATWIYNTIFVL